MTEYDAIIIGTGQAGTPLADRLTRAGMKVAIIERGKFGGTCVNTGCIPTKTMVASAYAAHMARRAADFGVVIGGDIKVDMRAVKARKDRVSGASNAGIKTWLDGMENCTIYRGQARFTGPKTVEVDGETLTAGKIFINVGGRAVLPDIPGLADVPSLNNSSMMDVDFLPEHLIILGGSYIGLEFGQMYRRFGSAVTIIETGPKLIKREDGEVSDAIADILRGEAIDLKLSSKVVSVAKTANGIAVQLEGPDGASVVKGSHLLVATGRKPNTADLGLDAAGVTVDGHGYITVDDQLRTNVEGIWAIGDCNGKGAFTHTSYNDFEIVAANLLDNDPRRVSDRITAYALYIDPPLGRIGMTEAEARKTGKNLLIAHRPMSRVSRAVEKGEDQGFMKIIVDADTRLILGASILGTSGDEAIHSILDVMYAKAPCDVIQRAVHIHPTVSELLPTLVGDLKPA
jgi:pyruvate/2-oxoglutarate dehydrogenase complex dihydrolipoamide dehydrogenase (E3) component